MLLLIRCFAFRCAAGTWDAIGCFRTHLRERAWCKKLFPLQPTGFFRVSIKRDYIPVDANANLRTRRAAE